MIHDSQTILGIDPGYGRVGYGIIHKNGSALSYGAAGCIETPKTDSSGQRLNAIYKKVHTVIQQENPALIAIEQLFFAKNTKTALRVAETRGILLLLGEKHRIPVYEYTPLQVKVAVCSYGQADKAQVQDMVARILRLAQPPQPDDAADALAIAITAAGNLQIHTSGA